MRRSINRVILLGRIGRDAETTQTSGGVAVSNFSLATARSVKTKSGGYKDQTDWHNLVVWQSENLAPYLTKGKQLLIEGRLHTTPGRTMGSVRVCEAWEVSCSAGGNRPDWLQAEWPGVWIRVARSGAALPRF